MNDEMPISKAFFEAADLFGKIFGVPLPKRILELGNAECGWGMKLNPTDEKIDSVPPFELALLWYGFPSGVITVSGGVIAVGEAANEDTFIEWLDEQHRYVGDSS